MAARARRVNEMRDAIQDVFNERQRQKIVEGYTTERDDNYTHNEMTSAAVGYAQHVVRRGWVHSSHIENYQSEACPSIWPWDEKYWKPKSPREDLVRAAALIIAEIERIDRAGGAADE